MVESREARRQTLRSTPRTDRMDLVVATPPRLGTVQPWRKSPGMTRTTGTSPRRGSDRVELVDFLTAHEHPFHATRRTPYRRELSELTARRVRPRSHIVVWADAPAQASAGRATRRASPDRHEAPGPECGMAWRGVQPPNRSMLSCRPRRGRCPSRRLRSPWLTSSGSPWRCRTCPGPGGIRQVR